MEIQEETETMAHVDRLEQTENKEQLGVRVRLAHQGKMDQRAPAGQSGPQVPKDRQETMENQERKEMLVDQERQEQTGCKD